MLGHKDATGYLLALRDEISHDWFSFACDLALAASDDKPGDEELKRLVALFCEEVKYTPASAASSAAPAPGFTGVSPVAAAPLRELTDFTNFKKPASTLEVTFDKRGGVLF